MQISKTTISHMKLIMVEISLDDESGTLNLKNSSINFPASGAIVQSVVKYASDSAGQDVDILLDGATAIALDDAVDTFSSYLEIFDRGVLFSKEDDLSLAYDVDEAVAVKLYISLDPIG
jgi:hypothetical protein